jgi:hypothetical protein
VRARDARGKVFVNHQDRALIAFCQRQRQHTFDPANEIFAVPPL